MAGAILMAACANGDGETPDATMSDVTVSDVTVSDRALLPTTIPSPIAETVTTMGGTTDLASTTTAMQTTTTDTTLPPTSAAIQIRPDGIGAALFGTAPEGVISFVSSVLGAPTSDSGWVNPFEIGPCPGSALRQVQWDTLFLEFGDVSNIAEGRRHFYSYYYGDAVRGTAEPADLATPEGLRIGSSVEDLLAVHPDVLLFPGDEFLGPNFQISDALRGTVTDLAATGLITSFVGGLPCTG